MEYIKTFYETIFSKVLKRENKILSIYNWKQRIIFSLVLYTAIIAIFHILVLLFNEKINELEHYRYAIYPLASLIFWPFIVIYDSELYYNTYKKLICLFKKDSNHYEWYKTSANESFNLSDEYSGFCINTFTIWVCIAIMIIIYILHSYCPKCLPFITGNPAILILISFIGFGCVLTTNKNMNINIISLVILCGYCYYVYLTEYSPHGILSLFGKDFIFGYLMLIPVVGVIFFIAGTTIYPMLGLFKAFFMTDFEDKLELPYKNSTQTVDSLNSIQKYFIHLTFINLIACFQLLAIVYSLGVLSRGSVVTIILFSLGSLFPITMYLAGDILYRKLINNIYLKQVAHIDKIIDSIMNKDDFDGQKIQSLIVLKQMYDSELDAHHEKRLDIIVALISPIVTAVLALIFPGVLG